MTRATFSRYFQITLLGFSSGLPLFLVGSTLQAWYTDVGIDIVTIGFLGLASQPYLFKVLWAPLFDRWGFKGLGRRRGWILLLQGGLALGLGILAYQDPAAAPTQVAVLALALAFLSSSQDIVVDAHRTEMLKPRERGLGSALYVGGYRIAVLVASGLALLAAAYMGWRLTYLLMAACMAMLAIMTYCVVVEPVTHPDLSHRPMSFITPFLQLLRREQGGLVLLLILTYHLGDGFILALNNPFLLRGVGFSLATVGGVSKTVGLTATLTGVLLGGAALRRMSLYRGLLCFGILQVLPNLLYMYLAIKGPYLGLMILAVGSENLFAGMGMAAFLAFAMALCDKRYTATQYALISALAAVGRIYAGPIAGMCVALMGWAHFYFWTFVISLPGILLVLALKSVIEQADGAHLAEELEQTHALP